MRAKMARTSYPERSSGFGKESLEVYWYGGEEEKRNVIAKKKEPSHQPPMRGLLGQSVVSLGSSRRSKVTGRDLIKKKVGGGRKGTLIGASKNQQTPFTIL